MRIFLFTRWLNFWIKNESNRSRAGWVGPDRPPNQALHIARGPHELIINPIKINVSLLFSKILYKNSDGNPQTIQVWLHYLTEHGRDHEKNDVSLSFKRERGIGWQKRQGRNHKCSRNIRTNLFNILPKKKHSK